MHAWNYLTLFEYYTLSFDISRAYFISQCAVWLGFEDAHDFLKTPRLYADVYVCQTPILRMIWVCMKSLPFIVESQFDFRSSIATVWIDFDEVSYLFNYLIV